MQRLTNLCSVLNDMEPICVLNHVFVLREVSHAESAKGPLLRCEPLLLISWTRFLLIRSKLAIYILLTCLVNLCLTY